MKNKNRDFIMFVSGYMVATISGYIIANINIDKKYFKEVINIYKNNAKLLKIAIETTWDLCTFEIEDTKNLRNVIKKYEEDYNKTIKELDEYINFNEKNASYWKLRKMSKHETCDKAHEFYNKLLEIKHLYFDKTESKG